MEQQSVSIAKAGHCSALPARSAVLAAANPKDGRYDVRKSMMVNMNLPAALLSRFDLQFLMLDKADAELDAEMAAHILGFFKNVHSYEEAPPTSLLGGPLSSSRNKRGRGRQQQQQQQQQKGSLIPQISSWYASTRFDEQQEERISGILPSYTTPRALLGVLRLSQALARLRESTLIELSDFEEALRLLESRTRSRLISEKGARWDGYVSVSELEGQASAVGISPQQLMLALEQYEELLILTFDEAKTKVAFIEEARGAAEDSEGEDIEADV
ncbi:hypothetical protein Emag_001977 [Eimeria magna]